MPKLRQRKSDGGYYIKRHARNIGFYTQQVADSGVAFLRQNGISLGDDIPTPLMEALSNAGYLYSYGTGASEQTTNPPEVSEPLPRNPLPMLLQLTENHSSLQLALPAFSSSSFEKLGGVDAALSLLTKCAFRVDRYGEISAVRLWPGKGEALYDVQPQASDYVISASGPWPHDFDLRAWTRGSMGLDPNGSLFNSSELGGRRLLPGEPATLGMTYHLVTKSHSSPANSDSCFARISTIAGLGEADSEDFWVVWRIDLPEYANDQITQWCFDRGHPLDESRWAVALVSPPPIRYSPSGIPTIEAKDEAIVAVSRPHGYSRAIEPDHLLVELDGVQIHPMPPDTDQSTPRAGSPPRVRQPMSSGTFTDSWDRCYFALPIAREGIYRVLPADRQGSQTSFMVTEVEQREMEMNSVISPSPLQVTIVCESDEIGIEAFIHGPGPHEIRLESLGESRNPSIVARSPVPFDVKWSYGDQRGASQRVQPDDLSGLLEAELEEGLSNGNLFLLRVDAGDFGLIQIHLFPPVFEKPRSSLSKGTYLNDYELPLHLARRARWLELTVPVFLNRGTFESVNLSKEITSGLSRLGNTPEGLVLARLTEAPLPLIPHLRALAVEITRLTSRDRLS